MSELHKSNLARTLIEENRALKKELAHWKANHANLVQKNHQLRHRPDLRPPESYNRTLERIAREAIGLVTSPRFYDDVYLLSVELDNLNLVGAREEINDEY